MCHISHKSAKSIVRAFQFLFFFFVSLLAHFQMDNNFFVFGYIRSRELRREMIRVLCVHIITLSVVAHPVGWSPDALTLSLSLSPAYELAAKHTFDSYGK